jgi:hypothetical protein
VFADKVDAYKEAENWSSYAGDILPLTLTANAGDNSGEYWTTYYNSLTNCQAPEGTRVFTVALDGSSLELTEIGDGIINRGEGVVLKSSSGSIPLYYSATGSETSYEGNELLGTMTRIANPGNAYVLNKKTAGVGFYRLSPSGTIGAHKAYLTYDGGIGAREFMPFDGDPTAVEEIKSSMFNGQWSMFNGQWSMVNGQWYDLSGRKYVSKPAKQGIYIHNGEKQVIP